jgi:hypothetical protein
MNYLGEKRCREEQERCLSPKEVSVPYTTAIEMAGRGEKGLLCWLLYH